MAARQKFIRMMMGKDAELASNLKYFYCVIILGVMVWLQSEVYKATKHFPECVNTVTAALRKPFLSSNTTLWSYTYRLIYTLQLHGLWSNSHAPSL